MLGFEEEEVVVVVCESRMEVIMRGCLGRPTLQMERNIEFVRCRPGKERFGSGDEGQDRQAMRGCFV